MTTQTMIILAVAGGALLILVVGFSFWGTRVLREAKYDFIRYSLLANNMCLLAALVHLVYLHKDYYALGYLLPILGSFTLFFSKRFKNLSA
ncbi:hypothetical protein [Candidatus Uabimicrobium amorphum]|uniref:Uncharacterized protein n=2 Tax=Uabimicrobium amorphum TaxID=2596890 RepID=A0A5S9IP10_UABAM|nr:hypothetical protein UABAM_03820 [Candidatus Uabimicrobium amorphum]